MSKIAYFEAQSRGCMLVPDVSEDLVTWAGEFFSSCAKGDAIGMLHLELIRCPNVR